ncbi:MAG: isochorismatase family protein [Candidatus Omnitrophica bacterium]|nr:isochorismatase family protein [Candidatus Omnitrophota bacterium]
MSILFFDIDTQYDFMRSGGRLYVPGAEKIIPRLKTLTRFADKERITIISSLDTHTKQDPEFRQFPAHCLVNTPGQKKIKETIARQTKQVFIKKHTFDVFTNPRTKKIVKNFAIALVYGVALDYCVKAACLGLVKAGLKTYLIKDATKAVTEKGKCQTLRLLKQKGVRFLTTQRAIKWIKRLKP